MVRRLAAVSALVLAGLAASPAAQAQGFFSFYETSPRDVVDRLYDQGYTVHLPMIRRGDVYVVDAAGPSHRPMRLIVSVHDGRVLERFATAARYSDDQPRFSHWRDDEADRNPDDYDAPRWERHTRTALGDPADLPPRAHDRDSDFDTRPVPPAPLADEPEKPRHHAKRHAPVARDAPDILPKSDAPVAAVAPSEPRPAPYMPAPSTPARVIDIPQAKAAPKPGPEAKPGPEPTSQARIEDRPAPRVIPLTKPAPAAEAREEAMPAPHQAPARVDDAPKPAPTSTQAKAEDKPALKPTPKPAPSAQAKVEDKPKAEVAAPKPDAPRKKLNDLPVGTLD
jgi:hypothetical protein